MNAVVLSIVCFAAVTIAVAIIWARLIEARPLSEDERDEWFGEGR